MPENHVQVAQPLRHRYFFALLPDPVTARRIHVFAQDEFGEKGLLRPERLHVTLALTADFDAGNRPVAAALRRAGAAVAAAPFDLLFDELSGGRGTSALRPAHALPPLKALHAAIAGSMKRQGIPMRPGYAFSPHMTLLYRDSAPHARRIDGFGWSVREFALIESLVGATRHIVLARWPLRPDPQLSLFGP